MSWKRMPFAACCLCLLLAGPGAAQPIFTGTRWGNPPNEPSAIGDFDNDGWPDVFRSGRNNASGRIALMHNEGGTHFVNQTDLIRAEIPANRKGGGPLFGDYDNDGDLDLFVPVGSFWAEERGRNVLLRNDRGLFTDVTLAAGLTDEFPTDNAIWLDYDRDGYIDLYTGNLACCPEDPTLRNKLYRNNGAGTFADVTEEAGLDIQLNSLAGGSNGGMAAGDFNDDGWPDLYVAVYDAPNHLFLNDGQGHFRDATTGEIADPGYAFDTAVGDIDNDLDLDIFQAAGGQARVDRSLMLLNVGKGAFLDVTEGVGVVLLGDTQGAGFGDIDNDGDLDLIIGVPQTVFFNTGDGIFAEQTAQAMPDGQWEAPSVFWDYNLDGFLDGQSWDTFFRNKGNDNHFLRVELVGIKSNRNGIGSRLIATSGELRQMQEILGGRGYNQDEMVAHFGLGQHTQIGRLEIRWPSGQVDVLTDIPADQKIRVIEGSGRYYRVEPTRWQQAPPETLVAGTTLHLNLTVQPALFDQDARITGVTADLSALGGPEAVPLQAENNGTYTLEPLPFAIEGPNSLRSLSIMIDQTTSIGPYWTRLSRQVVVVPDGDLVVFDETLAQDWQVEGDRRIKRLELSETGVVHRGRLAGVFEGETAFSPWAVTFKPPTPVSRVGYTALRFSFRPGEVVPPATARFTATLAPGKAVNLLENAQVDLNRQEWQVVKIPVEAFESTGPVAVITISGNFAGTFYLDDLRLVAATPPAITVVEEERTPARPQSFSLSQNFPNPFNSDTVIRFALPASAEVELEVYNLAGQRVVRLAEGVREAGNYTVRWDGRDDGGRELASGVYVYRLRAGEKVETGKALLLR